MAAEKRRSRPVGTDQIPMRKENAIDHSTRWMKSRNAASARMRILVTSFLLSALLHVSLIPLGRFIYRHFFMHPVQKETWIAIYPEVPLSGTRWENSRKEPSSVEGSDETGSAAGTTVVSAPSGNPTPKTGTSSGPPAGGSLPEGISYVRDVRAAAYSDTVASVLFSWKKHRPTFREALLGKTIETVDVDQKVRSWLAGENPVTGWTRPDPATEYVKKRIGQSSILALNAVKPPEEKKVEQNPPRFDFIPTPLQVMAMASVYRMKQPDQVQIYATLDPDLPVTAEGFNSNLEYLVKKGFLKRKKVSPENKLAIGSIFGGASIEMSRKNVLNPRYEYTATVDKNTLISFFQAQIFVLNDRLHAAPPDSFQIRRTIGSLQNMIQLLIQT
jgi:hypothetical protein